MKKLLILLVGLGALCPLPALAKVNVFSCAPEWSALAQEIGGEQVDIFTASKPSQDIHHMRAKPSLLAAMRKADLVICNGASLEVGWLPILLNKAGKAQVQSGGVGSIMATDYVEMMEVNANADRSMGHVHPEGNPHVHMHPKNILAVAEILVDRLQQIDPSQSGLFQSRHDAFKTSWKNAMQQWQTQAAPLKGKKVVVYHNSWVYLLDWLGMESVASLEPKPGIPPTASHLEKVLNSIQGQDITGILVAPYESAKAATWLSNKANLPILRPPYTVGGHGKANTLYDLFGETITMLKQPQ